MLSNVPTLHDYTCYNLKAIRLHPTFLLIIKIPCYFFLSVTKFMALSEMLLCVCVCVCYKRRNSLSACYISMPYVIYVSPIYRVLIFLVSYINQDCLFLMVQLYVRDTSKNWKLVQSDGNNRFSLKEPSANLVLLDYIASEKWNDVVDFDDHLDDISK